MYHVGDLVTVAGTLTTADGTVLDPDVVFVEYKAPDGTLTTLQYGVDVAVVKDGVGQYHVDINASIKGTWYYRFYSTGLGQGASEGIFQVAPSSF